jgi:hypothetical protein
MFGSMPGVGLGGVLPDMSMPGMSGSMLGVGVGVGVGTVPDISMPGIWPWSAGAGAGAGELSDISIPGIWPWSAGAGAGELSDISIPGISPWSAGAGALPDISIPDMAEDVGLDVSMITPKTALATASTTTGMTVRRVRVQLVM